MINKRTSYTKNKGNIMENDLSLIKIIDEASDLIEDRIDYLRDNRLHERLSYMGEFSFLKELRDLLKMAENFRDE